MVNPPSIDGLLRQAIAASHALRSYQFGNSSTELAKATADQLDAEIATFEAVKNFGFELVPRLEGKDARSA